MIVVKLEIWPGGSEGRAREIGRTYIANVGGSSQRGDYQAAVCRRGTSRVPAEISTASGHDPGDAPADTRSGQVHDYPRQSYNVWRLISRALRACFPEER